MADQLPKVANLGFTREDIKRFFHGNVLWCSPSEAKTLVVNVDIHPNKAYKSFQLDEWVLGICIHLSNSWHSCWCYQVIHLKEFGNYLEFSDTKQTL